MTNSSALTNYTSSLSLRVNRNAVAQGGAPQNSNNNNNNSGSPLRSQLANGGGESPSSAGGGGNDNVNGETPGRKATTDRVNGNSHVGMMGKETQHNGGCSTNGLTITERIVSTNGRHVGNNGYSQGQAPPNDDIITSKQQQRKVLDDKFEIPLPFGYHLDLDFLRVCSSGDDPAGESLRKLKELRKMRRKQRKQLEALMGYRQTSEVRSMAPEARLASSRSLSATGRTGLTTSLTTPRQRPADLQLSQPDIVNSSELVREALRESMVSFQATLDQYKNPDITDFDLIHGVTSTPNRDSKAGYSTFPRLNGSPDDPTGKHLSRHLSNSSISSVSTNSSALPYTLPLSPEAYLASLPSSVSRKPGEEEMETNSITSINSEMSTTTLRNIREQMARSLVKLKEYEKQVEAIPIMQAKLSVLKEEKRLLMLKLKAREAKLRRDRGELEDPDGPIEAQLLYDEAMDTDDEDMDPRGVRGYQQQKAHIGPAAEGSNLNRRARSESPYGKFSLTNAGGAVNPDEFLSVQRKRSTSCGFNSDCSEEVMSGSGKKYYYYHTVYNHYPTNGGSKLEGKDGKSGGGGKQDERVSSKSAPMLADKGINTEKEEAKQRKLSTREKAINTEAGTVGHNSSGFDAGKPAVITCNAATITESPRKVNHATNTFKSRSIPKGTSTDLKMGELYTRDFLETRVQEAMARTEEDIMSCPLLQKALAKVEEEALHGPQPEKEFKNRSCQVGEENLRPFVIDVGLTCHLLEDKKSSPIDLTDSWCQVSVAKPETRSVGCGLSSAEQAARVTSRGVGDHKVTDCDRPQPQPAASKDKKPSVRTVGVCTEKWIEVIRASKQTDTEDFAYKDTESPRVADLVLDPPTDAATTPRHQRLSSITVACLRKSTSVSPRNVMQKVFTRFEFVYCSVSRRSSTNSPSGSRKSSAAVDTRQKGTMTDLVGDDILKDKNTSSAAGRRRVSTRDASVSVDDSLGSGGKPLGSATLTKSVGTETGSLYLPLATSTSAANRKRHQVPQSLSSVLPPGSPLSTPDTHQPSLTLCDKCEKDIHQVAEGIMATNTSSPNIAPPSQDMPWLSKIPRPTAGSGISPELATKIKSSISTGNLSTSGTSGSVTSNNQSMTSSQGLGYQRSYSPSQYTRSKSNLSDTSGRGASGLRSSLTSSSQSSLLPRSKSNLEGGGGLNSRHLQPPGSMSGTPPPGRRDLGTPPPHPNTPPVGGKRAPSPLTRSSTPGQQSMASGEKKSLIPKFSPSMSRKTPTELSSSSERGPSGTSSPSVTSSQQQQHDSKSFIPRVVTPPALRKMFPAKSESDKAAASKDVVRKKTLSPSNTGVTNPSLDRSPGGDTRSSRISRLASSGGAAGALRKMSDIKERPDDDEEIDNDKKAAAGGASGDETETLDDADEVDGGSQSRKTSGTSAFPLPGSALFAPIVSAGDAEGTAVGSDRSRAKAEPSKEMRAALKVLHDSLQRKNSSASTQVTNAVNIIQQEWFKTSSTKQSNPQDVEDYLDHIEDMSKELLDRAVNLVDVNGNTALHYSVSHGNFDVVSVLIDSKVANPNILNKAGYTCCMLISLAVIRSEVHRSVVRQLFSLADVNLRATQHGQTALMLAVSHGRLDMVQLLLEAGADLNVRDEDGSTALMCAAEHGHMEIVKVLMQHPDVNLSATDNDGLTALAVAMEAGHRDIGVLLYANMSFSRGTSPHSSMRMKQSSSTASAASGARGSLSRNASAATSAAHSPVPPQRSRRNSSN